MKDEAAEWVLRLSYKVDAEGNRRPPCLSVTEHRRGQQRHESDRNGEGEERGSRRGERKLKEREEERRAERETEE